MNQHDTHKPATTQKIVTQQHSQPGLEEAAAEPQATEVAVDRADPRQTPYSASQQARMLQRMQRTIGNAQVQRMLSHSAAPVQRVTLPISAAPASTLSVSTPALSAPVASSAERQPEVPSAPVTVQRALSASPVIARITPVAQAAAPIARAGLVETLRNKAAEGARQLAMLAFQKAAGAAGVDPRPIMGLLNRAGGLLGQLIKNPAPFANTLVRGVGQGFRQFGSNISAHLQSGFGAWLFGTMGRAGISMPRDLSPSSVLSMVLQVLGVTPDRLKQRVAAQVGAKNVEGAQQAVGVLSTAMKGGLGGLWSMLKDELGDLKALVVDGIKDWLISSVVKAAVTKIASMFNPATGIVAAILSIANVIKFVVQRAGQIKALFQSVTDSVSALAQGNAQQLASKVEQTLARMVPLAIGLLSSLVGIGGVAGRVKQIISRVQSRVQSAIDKMIKRVADKFKGLLGRGGAATSGQSSPRQTASNRHLNTSFVAAGEQHRIWSEPAGNRETLMIASQKQTFDDFIKDMENKINRLPDADQQKEAKVLLQQAKSIGATVQKNIQEVAVSGASLRPGVQPRADQLFKVVEGQLNSLISVLKSVLVHEHPNPSGDDITYHPDMKDRAHRVKGWLKSNSGGRLQSQQTAVSSGINTLFTALKTQGVTIDLSFDAGHLVADRYGGEGSKRNLVPMEQRMNRSWFSSFEGEAARNQATLQPGERLYADVIADYDDEKPFESLIDREEIAQQMAGDPRRNDVLRLLNTNLDLFRSIPSRIRFFVGRRRSTGDSTAFNQVFSPRQRLALTIKAASANIVKRKEE